jgi:uncharacterized protein (TIGR02147 family)
MNAGGAGSGPEAFLKANLLLAGQALGSLPKEERDISAVTVSLSEDAAGMVRWELAQLRKKILSLAQTDSSHERVYQCNLQLFPLSE